MSEHHHLRTGRTSIRIGNRVYPAIRSNRCRVCLHPARPEIEEKLLFNEPYRRIAEWVSHQVQADGSTWEPISAKQLTSHFDKGHCPVDTQLLHEVAEELGHDYTTATGRMVSHVLLAKQTVALAQEALVRGEIKPTLAEGLKAGQLLAAIEASSRQLDQQDRLLLMEQAMMAYFNEAQKVMSAEQWQRFGQALAVSPVLAEIENKMASLDAVDAEFEEIA